MPPPTFRGVHLPSYRGFAMRKPPTFCQDMWKCLHREVSVLWDIFLEEVLLYTALWMRSLSSILLILDIKFWSKFSPNHTILVLNWSKIEEFSQFLKSFQLKMSMIITNTAFTHDKTHFLKVLLYSNPLDSRLWPFRCILH